MVVPGRAFGTPGYFRVSYCSDDRTIEGSLARLEKVLQEFNLCYNIAARRANMERRKKKAAVRDSVADNIAELQVKAETEPIAAFLGMRLIELSEGYAKVAMKLRPEYINFVGLVFGGIITSLVDEAFAYATNSVITPNVASQLNIYFIAGADVNDELTAECRVVKAGKRVCISEMTVVNQDGKLIASATGTTIPIINS